MSYDNWSGSQYQRLLDAMNAQSRIIEHLGSTRAIHDSLIASSGVRELLEAERNWRSQYERLLQPHLGLPATLDHLGRPSTTFQRLVEEQANSVKALLGSIDFSPTAQVRQMMESFAASQRFDVAGIVGGLSHRTALEDILGGMERDRRQIAEFAASLTPSFDVAQVIGSASVSAALEQSIGGLAKQYGEQFEQFRNRFLEMVGDVPTFDLVTTATWARFSGIDGLARQLASLGLAPQDFLGPEFVRAADGKIEATVAVGWKAKRLDDLRNLVIGLLVNLIFAIWLYPHLPNQDSEATSKRLDGIEDLVRKLPELMAKQVEEAVRRELEDDPVSFVVRERAARMTAEPISGSPVVAIVFPNQVLTLLDERGKWIKVEFYDYLKHDVRQGWLLKKYCERMPKRTRSR